MTRDEALKKLYAIEDNSFQSGLLSALVALGVLKLDEPNNNLTEIDTNGAGDEAGRATTES